MGVVAALTDPTGAYEIGRFLLVSDGKTNPTIEPPQLAASFVIRAHLSGSSGLELNCRMESARRFALRKKIFKCAAKSS